MTELWPNLEDAVLKCANTNDELICKEAKKWISCRNSFQAHFPVTNAREEAELQMSYKELWSIGNNLIKQLNNVDEQLGGYDQETIALYKKTGELLAKAQEDILKG